MRTDAGQAGTPRDKPGQRRASAHMADHFTKLWASILESSIWSEPVENRVVWITMLTMADRNGFVGASIDGLARRANVSIDAVRAALVTFQEPDPNSRNKDNEGRRIEEVPRGWHILNYAYFRDLRDEQARQEYERARKAAQRRRTPEPMSQDVRDTPGQQRDTSGTAGTKGDLSHVSAHVYADADADVEEEEGCRGTQKSTSRAPRSARARADRPEDVGVQVWEEFAALRKARRSPVTDTVVAGIRREAKAAGMTLEQALRTCVERGWQSFKADWAQSGGKLAPAKQAAHIPNMPLGHASCACAGCTSFRRARAGA